MANNPNLSATNVIRLNRTHSFLNLQQNFSNKILQSRLDFSRIPANYTNSAQFAHIIRKSHEIRTICYLLIHYVSGTCPGREPSGIPANYANSTQFAHIVHESHEIRTIC